MITIAAEHFPLTPAIKNQVNATLTKIEEVLPPSALIHVFLSQPSPKTFKALCLVRLWGKDFVVQKEDQNLYNAIDKANPNLTQKVIEDKHHWVRFRRKARLHKLHQAL